MTEIDEDAVWFIDHPDRMTHIRKARRGENEREFRTLGPHNTDRRAVIFWKAPPHSPHAGKVLKIPFLLFADETVEDRDDILMPIIDSIMRDRLHELRGVH